MAGRNSALGEFLAEPSTTDDLDEDNLSLALESLEERLQEQNACSPRCVAPSV